ncbi:hypothetical protein C4D60_Mb01t19700 [Musa balbisiana]|uniref:Conserved oligomeric Golgi complex subunit 7 n=1 Tax=Musa balbisiana TaxID=52838 RepID=A0A4S8JNE1_MUSBA|nr:hypothetical protein C4D60_Mb01t19700 [Musa balbisiana]
MVVVDVGEFGEESFDPKRWINAALESRHPQDPLDRYLSDLEENLRTSADKIADALDRESADALRRVPLACRDVLRLRDDALSLRSLVSSILLALSKMVVVDVGEFGEESFDPKRWINAALESRHPQDPLDRYLSDLEENLRTSADKIADALDRESADALRRVPLACRDVLRLRDDALSLRSLVSSILLALSKAEGTSAESIAAIAKIDIVKQRMEAAYETLQDAAGLTQLSASVEDVFASGDLPRAAETLANMRHCLSAVGEVAEFANVRKQLEVLEDRLEEMVQPRLFDALQNRKVEAVQDLRRILVRIGRFKSLELQYIKLGIKPLKKLWERFDSRQQAHKLETEKHHEYTNPISFSSWLPSFYDEVLLYMEQEWKWCMNALPDDYFSLVPKLLTETMSDLNASFVACINLATGDVVPETKALSKGITDILSGDVPKGTKILSRHLESLIELHNMTGAFAKNIQHLFSESDLQILLKTLKAVYSPYETFKLKYGQMERAILSSEIAGIDIRGAVARGVGAQGIELSETVRRMEESIPQTIVFLEAAIERCINFTGGSEADELILALDDIMLQYLSNLQETLKSLRTICGVDSPAQSDGLKKEGAARVVDMVSEEEEWSIVQGALQILTVADCLTSRTSVFEASLRATLARIGTTLSLSVFGSSLDQSHVAVTGENDVNLATRAGLGVAALRLADAPDKARKLFNLLEQLEPLAEGISSSESGTEEAQFFATEWMFKVAEGATALFMEQLRGIQYISDRGAQQLSADIEYLSNVLSALSMVIPPFLATFHTCLATPRDQLPAFLKSDGGSQLDIPTAHLVCKIRRIPLDQ